MRAIPWLIIGFPSGQFPRHICGGHPLIQGAPDPTPSDGISDLKSSRRFQFHFKSSSSSRSPLSQESSSCSMPFNIIVTPSDSFVKWRYMFLISQPATQTRHSHAPRLLNAQSMTSWSYRTFLDWRLLWLWRTSGEQKIQKEANEKFMVLPLNYPQSHPRGGVDESY